MDERSDEALMEAYARGSGPAFEELFRRYDRRVFTFFLRRVRSEDRAWDLYQELFLRLHRFRCAYEPPRPFRPWLFQIARHALIDDTRRAFRARELPTGAVAASREGDFERQLEARDDVAHFLDRLSGEEVRVLFESKLLGREYAEVAGPLGKSRDAVKKMASRSLRRLRAAASTG